MSILGDVDKPGSDIDLYVTNLDGLLVEKMKKIINIRKKLYSLHTKLKDEEVLSSKLSILDENKPNNTEETSMRNEFENYLEENQKYFEGNTNFNKPNDLINLKGELLKMNMGGGGGAGFNK